MKLTPEQHIAANRGLVLGMTTPLADIAQAIIQLAKELELPRAFIKRVPEGLRSLADEIEEQL